ncbi:hypothetical protein GU926_07960 [Nibribacter ruber]|uniref:Macroglobulin domain-containing protein n=1 Tax=Nibribacter ruber TaxID=2698458 RepID=A0A6P1NZL5_9BACT|nr:hypothetical protein [Nibribacter ruber]QHL87371.1 hypothetical protein GU926_07960 [Nibribacter ruber]
MKALWALLLLPLLAFMPRQNATWDHWLQQLQNWTAQEIAAPRVLLHLSQPFYASGDTLRFAAHNLQTASSTPEQISGLLQVEFRAVRLQDSRNYQFTLKEGVAQGAIPLADSLPAGEYELVAYTAGMPQGGVGQKVRILGPVQPEMADAKTLGLSTLQVSAFPEGGHLVAGVEGTLAVEALGDAAGLTGKVLDPANKTLATFKTDAAGKALLKLSPTVAQSLKVQVQNAQGQLAVATIPVLAAGIGLQVNTSNPSEVRVNLQPNLEWSKAAGNQEVLVAFITANGPVQSQKVNLAGGGPREITFIRGEASTGSAQVVVMNSAGQVEAARTFYARGISPALVHVRTDRQRYGRREKVTLTLTATNTAGAPMATHLSVAVQNAPMAASPEVLDWELRKMPVSYSLQNPNTEPTGRTAVEPSAGAGQGKKGIVVDIAGKPMAGATVMFMGEEEAGTIILNAQPDGSFVLQDPAFTSNSRLIYDVLQLGKRVEGARVQWQHAGSLQKVSGFKGPLVLTHQEKLYLQQAAQRKLFSRAFPGLRAGQTNANSLPTPLEQESIGAADRTFDLTKYVAFKNVEEVIKEVLPITNLINTPKGKEPRIFSLDLNTTFKEHPLYLVNGYPTFNTQWVLQLPGNQLEKVSLYYSTARLRRIGQMARNGVISITTLNKDLHPDAFKDDRTFFWDGLAPAFPFKAPVYEMTAQERIPDFRPLLYWAPSLTTDAKGQAVLTFYTSDDTGNFVIEVNGLTSSGQVIRQTHPLQVAAAL